MTESSAECGKRSGGENDTRVPGEAVNNMAPPTITPDIGAAPLVTPLAKVIMSGTMP